MARAWFAAASALLVTACTDALGVADPPSARGRPGVSRAIAAGDITVAVLRGATGVTVRPRGVSSAGYIVAIATMDDGSTRPFAWTAPYSVAPAQMSAGTGNEYPGTHSAPNDLGDVYGMIAAVPGYWSPDVTAATGWRRTSLLAGPYYVRTVRGINDALTIVGDGMLGNRAVALRWDGTSPSALPVELPSPAVPGPITVLAASDVNNVGAATGYVAYTVTINRKQTTVRRGVAWTGGPGNWQATLLEGAEGWGTTMNDAGQIAGLLSNSGAVLWSLLPSGAYGAPVALGASGDLVSIDRCARVVSGNSGRPWVWDRGTLTYLPLPSGASGANVRGIASPATGNGLIVGTATPRRGQDPILPVLWTIPGCPT